MAGGEVCFQVFSKVAEQRRRETRTDVPSFPLKECCFSLPVFADPSNADDVYRNDKHTPINKYDVNFYSVVTIVIQKYEDGAYVDKATVVDNSYGMSAGWGLFSSSDGRENYVALEADWLLIYNAFGDGTYRFKFDEVDFNTNSTETIYPFEFCLKLYTEERADTTTRFDTYTKGYRGDAEDDTNIWDFTFARGDGWFNQWRLPQSFFGYNKSGYEREFIRYQNGQQVWLQDEQVESYSWNSGFYPALLHNYIKTDILQADRIVVTDYNSNNPNIIKNKGIKVNGNYEPEWNYNNLKAFVNVDFVQEYQNRLKKRC